MPDWVSTTASVFAGGALTMASAWLADRRSANREREKLREERRERLIMRRNDFQRETLLALQVAAQKFIRGTSAAHHQDRIAFRQTGEWQKQLLGEDLSNNLLQFVAEVMLLGSRISDDEVRALANQLRAQASCVGRSSDKEAAEQWMLAASDTHQAIIERIGVLIREMDEWA